MSHAPGVLVSGACPSALMTRARTGCATAASAGSRRSGRMCGLSRDHDRDFTVKHFHEVLVAEHQYKHCYTVPPLAPVWRCRRRGWCARPPCAESIARSVSAGRCRACCCFRTARPMPPKPEKQDLIVTLDNATGQITSIFLTEHGDKFGLRQGRRDRSSLRHDGHGPRCRLWWQLLQQPKHDAQGRQGRYRRQQEEVGPAQPFRHLP